MTNKPEVHPDVISELIYKILAPIDNGGVVPYMIYQQLDTLGLLDKLDTSWKESDANETGDVNGIISNALWQHVYDCLGAELDIT